MPNWPSPSKMKSGVNAVHGASNKGSGSGLGSGSQTSLAGGYNAHGAASSAASHGAANSSNASQFNTMLDQFNQLQQQTMTENLQMQKAQSFWNPLESMSKKDATS